MKIRRSSKVISKITGKIRANKIPSLKFPWLLLKIKPTKVGPLEHPKSPAKARNANRAVPPFLKQEEAILKVPGHKIPTENPQSPQLSKLRNGKGEREMKT